MSESRQTETTAIAVADRPAHALMRPLVSPADMIKLHREMADFVKQALVEGVDYGTIPNTDKPTMYKSGAERMYIACGCFPRYSIIESEIDHDVEFPWLKRKKRFTEAGRFDGWEEERGTGIGRYRYVVKCELVRRDDGVVVAEGIGSASTLESRYIDRPRDCENTVAKMAQKRAMVAATLNGFGLSGMFSQDLEDMTDAQGGGEQRRGGNGKKKQQQQTKQATKKATAEQLAKLTTWATDDRVPENLRAWLAGQLKQAEKAGLAAETATKWISQLLQKVPALGEPEQPPPEPESAIDGEPEREPGEEG